MVSFLTKTSQPVSKKRRILISLAVLFVVVIVGGGLWFGSTILQATGKIISDNTSGGSILFRKRAEDVKPAELKGEGDGRINIAIYGRGGASHPGGNLTDVIKVLSLDPQNKKIALLSIPRDLWVKTSKSTYAKINTAYSDGERKKKDSGPDNANYVLEDLLDLPQIHYFISVDFEALKKLVDTLGGVTINVEKALDDPYYPAANMIDYAPLHIKAGTQKMNGDLALKYSRSRETTSDFDRARRQEQVMVAIKDQVLSANVLANPKKIHDIITILGDHVRTNLQVNEMQQLLKLVQESDPTIISKVLDTAADGPLMSASDERGYVIVPRDGDYSYKEVKRIAHEIFTDPYLVKESARIEVRNATTKAGLGTTVSGILKSNSYNVVKVANNETKEPYTELINYAATKYPFTLSFLERRFNVKARAVTRPVNQTADIVLVLGDDYEYTVQKQQNAKASNR